MLVEKRLGLAGGILWGVMMFIMTFANIFFGYGTTFLNLMADVYPGYSVSYIGSLIGLGYGFLDGFIGLYILAWLYNKINA
ncbi:MAG: bacteriophage holin [Chlamydiales bacterium]|nr:bacteriophage holin [Chlamydiia bacterium]MCP5508587.1 bacteriophage holin [Chlamydiales bacterium]